MNENIFNTFAQERGLSDWTKKQYKNRLDKYCKFTGQTLTELIEEAEQEEEQGIRWKHRQIKQKLTKYQLYLQKKYMKKTVKAYLNTIKTFYIHFDIEIHHIPTLNEKAYNLPEPINFKDLPDKEIIKQSLLIADPLMSAIILFISSSGSARNETLSLTIQDFIDATYEYHHKDNINEVIDELSNRDDVVPFFKIKRQKTNKYYYTFCSPEAVEAIITYLIHRKDELSPNSKLFKIVREYMSLKFAELNDKMELGKKGSYNRFRSHMLRKFHSSNLYNAGMTLEEIDALQGRGKDSTHSAYFMEDPEKLRQRYIEHMDAVTINWNVNSLDIKSREYIELETKYTEKEEEVNTMHSELEDLKWEHQLQQDAIEMIQKKLAEK